MRDKPDFDFILDNQIELFRQYNTIIKWSFLNDIIDTNVDLSNRYKTFDGKVWDKVEELDDAMLFVHINISAYNYVTRIEKVME